VPIRLFSFITRKRNRDSCNPSRHGFKLVSLHRTYGYSPQCRVPFQARPSQPIFEQHVPRYTSHSLNSDFPREEFMFNIASKKGNRSDHHVLRPAHTTAIIAGFGTTCGGTTINASVPSFWDLRWSFVVQTLFLENIRITRSRSIPLAPTFLKIDAATPVSHPLARRHELNVPKCIQGAEQNIEFVLRHER
jgi:hypothetical protein